MSRAADFERRIKQSEPLVELLDNFPGAHSLHSTQAEMISRGSWNIHALRNLIDDVEAVISSSNLSLSGAIKILYFRAKDVYEIAKRAEENGITTFSYASECDAYQRASA